MTQGLANRLMCGLVGVLLVAAGGCQGTYYKAWEKLGWAKRDILVDRVKDAREDQEAAKKQFKTTLEQFQALTGFEGGELEAKYKQLNREYEASEARAADVRKRIKSVDDVAQELFKEWSKELDEYNNAELKQSSEQKLRDTREHYRQMYAAMTSAEAKMAPVLKTFKTQVLYLKHNLNAAAIGSLQTQVGVIRGDVDSLIRDMEASIKEADAFIVQLK